MWRMGEEALCSVKGIVESCLDKVTRGPVGHESEGHQRQGRTDLTGRGHRGRS